MGRFARKYTEAQTAAVVRACVDGGMSPKRAVAQAETLGLDGLPPFAYNWRTAADYATDERRRRELTLVRLDPAVPDDETLALNRRAVLQSALDVRLAQIAKRATHGSVDPEEIRAVARAQREVDGMRRAKQKPPAKTPEKAAAKTAGLLERLDARDQKAKRRVPSKNGQASEGRKAPSEAEDAPRQPVVASADSGARAS